jgi:hypothetical protein
MHYLGISGGLENLAMTRYRCTALAGILLLACSMLQSGCAEPEQRTYERAIKDASVRGPGWDFALWPLPSGVISVSTFTDDTALDVRSLYVWVAATQEVWQKCRGKRDSVLALEQILGLPPLKKAKSGNPWHFFVFELDSRDLLRPCPGGVEGEASGRPSCRLISDLDLHLDAEFTQFLLQQWWLSHRSTIEYGRDPELGYPWTGMGWTYDWDPASATHRGVSEFVVRKTAAIGPVRTMTPEGFCGAHAAPLE